MRYLAPRIGVGVERVSARHKYPEAAYGCAAHVASGARFRGGKIEARGTELAVALACVPKQASRVLSSLV